jgi:hypothetical protein
MAHADRAPTSRLFAAHSGCVIDSTLAAWLIRAEALDALEMSSGEVRAGRLLLTDGGTSAPAGAQAAHRQTGAPVALRVRASMSRGDSAGVASFSTTWYRRRYRRAGVPARVWRRGQGAVVALWRTGRSQGRADGRGEFGAIIIEDTAQGSGCSGRGGGTLGV